MTIYWQLQALFEVCAFLQRERGLFNLSCALNSSQRLIWISEVHARQTPIWAALTGHLHLFHDSELSTWSAVRVHEVRMLYMYVGQLRDQHYGRKEGRRECSEWLYRKNVINELFVDQENIYIPPLHEAWVNRTVQACSRQWWVVLQLPVLSLSLTGHWQA